RRAIARFTSKSRKRLAVSWQGCCYCRRCQGGQHATTRTLDDRCHARRDRLLVASAEAAVGDRAPGDCTAGELEPHGRFRQVGGERSEERRVGKWGARRGRGG